ncbi:hypothetical protein [Parablautia muri]|uniref:Uncharacterized protein n=1 Tax=Parablautia muri TaxID=2320879 RepID=A0A9X5BGF4_9FIRM|nr:hypothetical protein [Parablautia muri]NBJ93208.1 hypothetical protein [Parablautia muri]
MVVKAETLLSMDEFEGMDENALSMKLEAVESLIRSYTNNNFQNRAMRIEAPASQGLLLGRSPFFKVGDTVQISQSKVNDGLYVITGIDADSITVNKELFDAPSNRVTKIIYPADVQKGVIDLMLWEKGSRQKVGIKSETLSRHSVTYYDQDSSNQVMGYPVSLLGFLKPYIKPRF